MLSTLGACYHHRESAHRPELGAPSPTTSTTRKYTCETIEGGCGTATLTQTVRGEETHRRLCVETPRQELMVETHWRAGALRAAVVEHRFLGFQREVRAEVGPAGLALSASGVLAPSHHTLAWGDASAFDVGHPLGWAPFVQAQGPRRVVRWPPDAPRPVVEHVEVEQRSDGWTSVRTEHGWVGLRLDEADVRHLRWRPSGGPREWWRLSPGSE